MLKGLRTLITGLLAGATLGMLFSPDKGKSLRKKIKDEMDNGGSGFNAIKDTVKEFGRDIGESSKDVYEDITESEGYKNAKKKVQKTVKDKTTTAQRRKVKKAVKKAKDSANKAKKAVDKASKTVKKATSKFKKK